MLDLSRPLTSYSSPGNLELRDYMYPLVLPYKAV